MRLEIIKPFDAHAHLRSGSVLRAVLPLAARQFARVVAMPNLAPPLTSAAMVRAYRDEILLACREKHLTVEPVMSLYLTDNTSPGDLETGFREGIIRLAKLYPAGATTNSDSGVTSLKKIFPVLDKMQRLGIVLSVHGEVNDPDVDVFDREAVFIDRVLAPLRRDFPALKIVFEHLTTRKAVEFVLGEGGKGTTGATITAHHLRITRNDMLSGGLKPHYYCMPVAKTESDRQALIKAAVSGNPAFFAGTDSAPHPRTAKECASGAAGCFTHADALALYAQTFDEAGALNMLESFASLNGPTFYGLAMADNPVTLERSGLPQEEIKPILTSDGAEIVPFRDKKPVYWRLMERP